MINGAHAILFSKSPEQDREFLRDILKLSHVDVGGGWLIFGLPPAEVAIHPAEESGAQELYLMCADVEAFIVEMSAHDIECSAVQDQGWGLLTQMTLPGGGALKVYEPRHARPALPSAAKPKAKSSAPRKKSGRPGKRTPARKTSPEPSPKTLRNAAKPPPKSAKKARKTAKKARKR